MPYVGKRTRASLNGCVWRVKGRSGDDILEGSEYQTSGQEGLTESLGILSRRVSLTKAVLQEYGVAVGFQNEWKDRDERAI